jgi:hypothetical protein
VSGEYSVPCQRCGKRSAVGRKIDNTKAAWVFSSASGRMSHEVRLCGSCFKTVESLTVSVAKAKSRSKGSI